jgi:hypothetical protein
MSGRSSSMTKIRNHIDLARLDIDDECRPLLAAAEQQDALPAFATQASISAASWALRSPPFMALSAGRSRPGFHSLAELLASDPIRPMSRSGGSALDRAAVLAGDLPP